MQVVWLMFVCWGSSRMTDDLITGDNGAKNDKRLATTTALRCIVDDCEEDEANSSRTCMSRTLDG